MDVHTPKPVHSLRELAREIGIIVIGVLIALGGEQLVVALNRAYEARATEEALRREVGISLIYAAERVMVGPCLKGRLVELSQALPLVGRGELATSGPVFRQRMARPPEGGTTPPGRPSWQVAALLT